MPSSTGSPGPRGGRRDRPTPSSRSPRIGRRIWARLIGPPVFAAEVRNENDYGPEAERSLASKRADYFAAGTLVVWDVDVLRAFEVRVYRAGRPDQPDVFRRGNLADAEPALPGWSMMVDELLAVRR